MRNRYFKEYWNGKVVAPADYLKGMACMWIATEIGGIIALVGCFMANDLVPNILPAAAAFGLFVPFWPSGHAMTRPVGLVDDNEVYEDPR